MSARQTVAESEPVQAERPAGAVVLRAEGLSKAYPRRGASLGNRIFSRFGGLAPGGADDEDEVEEVDEDAEELSSGWVLRNVDLELRAGSATGVAGPRNSGKTSLVEALAGLAPPTEGRVWAAGRVVPVQDNVTKLMQDGAAWRNVVLLARILGLTRRWARSRLDSIFELADLEGARNRPRKALTTPEAQRIGIATMLHVDGVAYLVDSTLGGTDVAFRERCLALLAARREAGAAILHTSRDLDGVDRLADTVVWLERGSVVARGTPEEVAAVVGEGRARRQEVTRPEPTEDAGRLYEFLRIALGDVLAADALHEATEAARHAAAETVDWPALAAAAGYDVAQAQRVVDRLAQRAAGGGIRDRRRG
jgi:ABC-type polysaccharide/polyol phosphate transport system ATPase subunit